MDLMNKENLEVDGKFPLAKGYYPEKNFILNKQIEIISIVCFIFLTILFIYNLIKYKKINKIILILWVISFLFIIASFTVIPQMIFPYSTFYY